jgi:isopenicillin N synthase-like dioxygenase
MPRSQLVPILAYVYIYGFTDVLQESYDIGSDENITQPNQWLPEDSLPGFRDFMCRFYWECSRVGGDILQALAVGLELDENYLLEKHSGHNNQLRLLHYPPIPAEAIETERAARCPAHTDWSSITMLFQDDCGGLEVEDISSPGTFIPATPIKNAIVMNVGDLLQRWSNGLSSDPGLFAGADLYRSLEVDQPSSHFATSS